MIIENVKELSKEGLINKLNGILYEIKALAKQAEDNEKIVDILTQILV